MPQSPSHPGDQLWPPTATTPPAAPQKTAPPADAGATQWEDTAQASPSTDSCAPTTTNNCEQLTGINLLRHLLILSRWRTKLLYIFLINDQIGSLAARQQAELLIADAQSIQSLIADLPHQKK